MMSTQHSQIQFLAHASFRINTPEGRVILVDPWYTNNPFLPTDITIPERVDLILITHGHRDHLDRNIIELIRTKSPKVIANPIVRYYLQEQGVPEHTFEQMNAGGTICVMDLKITMTNAFHFAQVNLPDGKIGYPHTTNGFIIWMSDDISVYYSGDTSVFADMELLGEIYEPDIAILPIGDRYTMGPLEAAFAIRLLKVKHVIPCHYGTMSTLTGTPEKLKALTEDIERLVIHALKPGETLDTFVVKPGNH
ncbi:metal-dependent hydrolase [Chitinophaga polysaccharea]|uniref:metal-dependent hydrolase n=1 Tax=Chitinophaga polysaccharea TaxID=1293035 RepID=UPI00145575DB|nr:metal-dependent hydrolase [Chitinophaga polysaccharea]NLR59998.1 metal-dependent hydrolase [Chitinophaga polysaccharea]